MGALLVWGGCLHTLGPLYVLLTLWRLRREVDQALEVTRGLPLPLPRAWLSPWSWPARPTYPQLSAVVRWLGHGRRQQARSLALLVLGLLLALT